MVMKSMFFIILSFVPCTTLFAATNAVSLMSRPRHLQEACSVSSSFCMPTTSNGVQSFVASADIFGEEVRMTNGNPSVMRMATTYVPQYLSRNGSVSVTFGRFCFGDRISRIHRGNGATIDDTQQSLVVQYNMDAREEYRHFRKVNLFFDKAQHRLYKIVAEQTFPLESLARDRMMTINGIIEDCKQGYGLSLVRTVATDNQILYEGSDEIIEATLEMCKQSDGKKKLVFSVLNKKVQIGEPQVLNFGDTIDIADYVEVQI